MSMSPNQSGLEYVSTRKPEIKGSYAQTVIEGLSPEGGLYMPTQMPEAFDEAFISRLPDMKMSEVSFELMRRFVPREAVDDKTLKEMMEEAHNFDIPVDHIDEHTSVAHLDEGPTAAFKDIAARVLAQLLSYENEKRGGRTNILTATSGDTGVAIADAFSGKKSETVTVLYPTNGVSPIQEKHMLDVAANNRNVQVIPVEGKFNYAQDLAKILLRAGKLDSESAEDIGIIRKEIKELLEQDLSDDQVVRLMWDAKGDSLGSANSINFWRLAPQMTQYFVAYGQMVKQGRIKDGDELTFAVPTGNAGHLVAGVMARKMGLPINKFVAGTNHNNGLAYLIGNKVIQTDGKHETAAPSMDIDEPNNLERLLWLVVQQEDSKVDVKYAEIQQAIRQFKQGNDPIPLSQFGVSDEVIDYLQDLIFAEDITSDKAIAEEMGRVSRLTGGKVVVDSHGAAGTNAAKVAREKGWIAQDQVVCALKTAHPDKFPEPEEAAGVAAPKKHPALEPLKAMRLEDMDKPQATRDILEVRRRVDVLSKAA